LIDAVRPIAAAQCLFDVVRGRATDGFQIRGIEIGTDKRTPPTQTACSCSLVLQPAGSIQWMTQYQ
jgi:hypothetical protein